MILAHPTKILPLLLLLLFIATTAWLYLPGTQGPALLDDQSSVAVLDGVHGNPAYALDLVLGDTSGPLGRPVAMATFVAERLLADADIGLSKRVNIALHLFNGLLIAWLLLLLLRSVGGSSTTWLAVLCGGLWLVSPLFISTVLYAVQRMAMLACTFMVLSLIAYVYWRHSLVSHRHSWTRFALVPVFFVMAVFSKENAIVVLPIIVLTELLWFNCRNDDGSRNPFLWRGCLVLMGCGAGVVVWLFLVTPDSLLGSYQVREFTLGERLLTENRILWDYVGQLVWPDVKRMGIYHDDIVVSRSLIEPFSTLYAVVAWIAVLLFLLMGLRSQLGRRLGFCVLFFLVGHSVESTVLPLELYFEHRNYFPAIGLFLIPGLLIAEAARRWRVLASPLVSYLGVCVLLLALQAGSQVQIWSSSHLLRLNQVIAHPGSFRANADMAVLYARVGGIKDALEYSRRAHEVSRERTGDHYIRNLVLSCIAGKPLPAGMEPGPEALANPRPLSSVATAQAFLQNLQDGRCPHLNTVEIADSLAMAYLGTDPVASASSNLYSVMAALENALERYDNAYEYTVRFLEASPNNTRGLLMQLHFTTALGKVAEAAVLKQQLQELQAAGKLTIADQQTLALYLE